jgi:hypothetical protein
LLVLRHPTLRGSERDSGCSRDRRQRSLVLQVRSEQAKSMKGELSGLFREPRQFVHTRKGTPNSAQNSTPHNLQSDTASLARPLATRVKPPGLLTRRGSCA